ncbi:hypothetical protein PPTG_19964 [Phytophthora nicotianae INRA-310]|uniref:ATP-dependent DNA helicase n=1 Tax=Phytophthora nicotianae (strain INRA-310) TaxID=761204 RepID=W2PB87_PHYN3|nr:hypothetical protein PPTG_19964 [Phytophthora nicotianae INRA-310]ETM97925.1 hypothetical protein PPTG_19964 [Phytophthora nicotianae INRA-310]
MRIKHSIEDKSFATLDAYKQVSNVPFGGVHIILVRDFLQMQPVGVDAIFVDPTTKSHPSTADIDSFELWRRFTTVVVLDETVRFRNDPEWGRGCANARVGEWTQEFVDILNNRVVQPSDAEVKAELTLKAGVFVTPENVKRLAINNTFFS